MFIDGATRNGSNKSESLFYIKHLTHPGFDYYKIHKMQNITTLFTNYNRRLENNRPQCDQMFIEKMGCGPDLEEVKCL